MEGVLWRHLCHQAAYLKSGINPDFKEEPTVNCRYLLTINYFLDGSFASL
jgi:hypothetical protein